MATTTRPSSTRPTWLLQFALGIAVVVTISALGVKLYRLHDHAHIRYDPRQEIIWRAPTHADVGRRDVIISNTRWRQNYSDIERILWEAQDLGDNSSTSLVLLERINSLLPEDLETDELVRLRNLVEKSLLNEEAQMFAGWIVNYFHYRKTDQQLKLAINQAQDDQRVSLIRSYLANMNATQEKHFGKHAKFLFTQQNDQTYYFFQRSLVRLDNSLNELQKKAALEAIKQDYQAKLESLGAD